jgi:hypothetical protein
VTTPSATLIVAAAALAGAAIVAARAIEPVLDAYLVAAVFWLNLALGGLALALTHALTGGRWGAWARPAGALLARALVPLAVVLLPLLLVYTRLLPGGGEALEPQQRTYLAAPWFSARYALYFVVWIGLAVALARKRRRAGGVAAAGAVLYVLTATLFCVDWLASSRPSATGTIVGLVLIGGHLTGACAVAVVLASLRTGATAATARRQDLANLLFAAIMFYGYTLVMQLLIIWSANLPPENEWYLARGGAVGFTALLGLVICHGLALALLLSRRVKRARGALLAIGGLVIVGHLFDTYWWLGPLLDASPARALDLAMIALLGFVCWGVAVRLGRTPAFGEVRS